jgi:hypothetical protein
LNWRIEKIADFIFESSFVVKVFLFVGTLVLTFPVLGLIFKGIGYVFIEIFGLFTSYSTEDFSDFGRFLALLFAALVTMLATYEVQNRRIKSSEKKESALKIAGPEKILNLRMCANDGVVQAQKPFRLFVTEQPPYYLMVTNKRLFFLRQNHVIPFWGELYYSAFGVKGLLERAGKIDEANSNIITPDQIKQLRSEFFNFREYFPQDIQNITVTRKSDDLNFILFLKNGEEHKFRLHPNDSKFAKDLESALKTFK